VSRQWRAPKIRRPRAEVEPHLLAVLEELADDNPGVEYVVGGSWRRGAESIGDIDILLIHDGPLTANLFEPGIVLPSLVGWQRSGSRIANGDYRMPDGTALHVDLWVQPPVSRAAALLFVTGSQETNLRMRGRAKAMGLGLSQDKLFVRATGEQVPGTEHDEEAIFSALRLPYLPPHRR
jgi:DNA polymerase/3'-5' exonuclease PolX